MTSTYCCHVRRDGVPFENYAQATLFENGRYVADMDSPEVSNVVAFEGLNGGMLKLIFGDGCVMYDEFTCKKL